MNNEKLLEAVHKLANKFTYEEGLRGAGVGDNHLFLYVNEIDSPIAKPFLNGQTFEGFEVIVEKVGDIIAY